MAATRKQEKPEIPGPFHFFKVKFGKE